MNMPERYYQNKAFSFQDEVLRLIQKAGSPFYLTGGTALSRCYLHHRYSDDLDLFVNADLNFKTDCDKILSVLKERSGWKTEVGTVAETFVRLMLEKEGAFLKVDLVNDIRFHWGGFQECSIYYRVDNQRNILSNKLCSLSRRDIKDLADILFIAQTYEFEWEEIFEDAKQKDLWVDPLEICKIIDECPLELFRNIKWISSVNIEELHVSLKILRDDIFWGRGNSLAKAD
jgi:predicted nucleotidyltransferase component of viral defense system